MEITLVTQPTPLTCVHACLAMVSGRQIQEFIDQFGDGGLNMQQETVALIESRILPHVIQSDGFIHLFPTTGIYLVTVPSLNLPGMLHRVVVDAKSDGYVVYDPNHGRAVKAYSSEDIASGAMNCFEITLLDFETLARMTVAA